MPTYAVICFFNKERTDYLMVGPFTSHRDAVEESNRLFKIYAIPVTVDVTMMVTPRPMKP